MKCLAIIPARYQSSRFPGKPLAMIHGKTMIQLVIEKAKSATLIDKVLVATDDERIMNHVQSIDCECIMTSSNHESGTDRCAEAAAFYPEYDIVINIQGDEPFIDPHQLDALISYQINVQECQIATMYYPIIASDSLFDPNVVKVVFGGNKALYFSRNPIPFIRQDEQSKWINHAAHYKHIGIYGFKANALAAITKLPKGRLEQLEMLEQLRWLESGYNIDIIASTKESFGIDTPEDLAKILTKEISF
ncbi:MAG: 3-deoxy-manno-octulosonate cytidylyltransferase [Saprospiraceae bacterium]|nr:3-deoxy-manno-octulosonate cytidylyltransferase [Saprospiraceae bacterium]